MRFVDEYRQLDTARTLIHRISSQASRRWTLMEVCGGQTHSLMKYGLVELLEPFVSLIHGPGCPVCVTEASYIDSAICLARSSGVTLATFGDLMRVPGRSHSLLTAATDGATVLPVYSPIDAVRFASQHPNEQVVFFAVGFETTVPATALAVKQAQQRKLTNFSVLNAHVRVLPAMSVMAQEPARSLDGFLAAGHVCSVTGWKDYCSFAEQYRIPVVVTGFEPVDLLLGIEQCVSLLEKGEPTAVNAYPRAVTLEGHSQTHALISEVFLPADREWRGLGRIPLGGFGFQPEYQQFDAQTQFDSLLNDAMGKAGNADASPDESIDLRSSCIAGEILTGKRRPCECSHFGNACTPETPLGAPMVSSEGACAAWFRYRPTAK
ncbi:MAG: hydrogenase formation protein HypD [Planctomycetaceae bacterium]